MQEEKYYTLAEIAEILGSQKPTVEKRLAGYEYARKKHKNKYIYPWSAVHSAMRLDLVAELENKKEYITIAEVAQRLLLDDSQVGGALRKHGIKGIMHPYRVRMYFPKAAALKAAKKYRKGVEERARANEKRLKELDAEFMDENYKDPEPVQYVFDKNLRRSRPRTPQDDIEDAKKEKWIWGVNYGL